MPHATNDVGRDTVQSPVRENLGLELTSMITPLSCPITTVKWSGNFGHVSLFYAFCGAPTGMKIRRRRTRKGEGEYANLCKLSNPKR